VKRCPAPYVAGDRLMVLRDEADRGTVWGALTVERVTALSDGRTWRLGFTRGDGTAVEVTVGPDGRDRHGYVARPS
jgi:hypothetical protein